MKEQTPQSPFGNEELTEHPLTNAPLKRAIVQLRFFPIQKLSLLEHVALFQDRIRSRFPIQNKSEFHINVDGQNSQSIVIWSFQSIDQKRSVTLSQEFLALETLAYTSRESFIDDFRFIYDGFHACNYEAIFQRLGMRYFNQITFDRLDEVKPWVRPQTLGFANDFPNASLSISENIFQVSNAQLLIKCGVLPRGMVHDPQVVQPTDRDSWILDIDCYTTDQSLLIQSQLQMDQLAFDFSKRIYEFFRWSVTTQFLEEHSK